MKNLLHNLLQFTVALGLWLPLIASADAGDALLYSLEGSATKKSQASNNWEALNAKDILKAGETIRVGENSRAAIEMANGLLVRLQAGAELTLQGQAAGQGGVFLGSGTAHFLNRITNDAPPVTTNVVSAAIRGTEFIVEAKPKQTNIAVLEGKIVASNKAGEATITSGQLGVVDIGKAPIVSALLDPKNAIQWTATIPAALLASDYRNNPALQGAFQSIAQNDLRSALNKITAKSFKPNASSKLLESQILLRLGQIEAAKKIIASNKFSGAQLAIANSSNSFLALSSDNKETATKLANEAVAADSNSALAYLALSQAKQASLDLAGAKQALVSGLSKNPNDPRLNARLAEIELGFGNVDEAKRLVNLALTTDANNSDAQTRLGFIELLEENYASATKIFDKVASAQPGAGLPMLGLGLANIAQGNQSQGKEYLLRAAHLEPNRAAFRSYLAKAFFEEDNEHYALRELDEAIRLDNEDPTPWLYKSFVSLSANRPVAALSELESAIERNDNRAVYRSSLLLDSDEAVRSAGLSRIFTNLGFNDPARVEAIKSINKDYDNFSAHRLFADTASDIFLADAALSERRVAELLSPLNFNLLSSLGGQASLNEYDAIFDGAQARTSGELTYDARYSSLSPSVVHAAKQGSYGYALAIDSSIADGSKENNFQRDYRINAALRHKPNYKTGLLLDLKGKYISYNNENLDEEQARFDGYTAGLGFSYRPTNHSTIIAESSVDRGRTKSHNADGVRTIDSTQIFEGIEDTISDDILIDQHKKERVTTTRSGLQFSHNSELLTSVIGIESIHQSIKRNEESVILDDSLGELTGLGLEVDSAAINGLTSTDFYAYETLHALSWLDFTAGLVHSDVEYGVSEVAPYLPEERNRDGLNPKFGVVATPAKNLTLRAAYFKGLRKSSLESQVSIQPTLIGGILQTYNDLTATESENVGLGVDYKIAAKTYLGAEWVHRHLKESIFEVLQELVVDFDLSDQFFDAALSEEGEPLVSQDFTRAYIHQVLTDSLVGSVEYRYSWQNVVDPVEASNTVDHRVSSSLRYFYDNGLFLLGRATWRQGSSEYAFADPISDSFWLFDAGLGYRLKNRRGLLSLELKNITNEDFDIDQTTGFDEQLHHERAIVAGASFNF